MAYSPYDPLARLAAMNQFRQPYGGGGPALNYGAISARGGRSIPRNQDPNTYADYYTQQPPPYPPVTKPTVVPYRPPLASRPQPRDYGGQEPQGPRPIIDRFPNMDR